MSIKILTNWRYLEQNLIEASKFIKRIRLIKKRFKLKRWKFRINATRFTNSNKRKQKVK